MPVLAIPFSPMPLAQNPNVRRAVNVQDVYMKAAFLAFASFSRWNPNWKLVLLMSSEPSVYWNRKFASIDVEVQVAEFKHFPPPGFAPTFAGSLFLVDAISHFRECDYLLLIDPDVLTISNFDLNSDVLKRLSVLPIPHEPDEKINRVSLRESEEIHIQLHEQRGIPRHFGGEFYGIPHDHMDRLIQRLEKAWNQSLLNFEKGLPYLTTEEHLMNFALAGFELLESEHVIRRIWTAHSFRSVNGGEKELVMWHLPSEKERGFSRLYKLAQKQNSWFWNAEREVFAREAAKVFGLSNRDPLRWALDTAGQVYRLVRKN